MKPYIIKSKYYDRLTPEERADCCNGCGPDWFPDSLRNKLDKILDRFRGCFDQHDITYEFGETWEDKIAGDRDFLKNMRAVCWHEILMNDPFSYSNWRKYFAWRSIARVLFEAVDHCGADAFWHEEKLSRLGLAKWPPDRKKKVF